ncbi:MAG: thioredoxin family protein [Candidatus Promineifilaceae bacterium]
MGLFGFLKKDKGEPRSGVVIDVTDSTFKRQVIQRSHKMPVLVDFWATWCRPCQVLGPILEDLALEPQSKFTLAKLNTEYNQQTARQQQIQSIPAVKMFRNGQVVDDFTGARPGGLVKRFVNKSLEKSLPAPKISGSSDPGQRLVQARRHLAKGRGFEAYVLLDNFPEGAEQADAQTLLPVASFLFDMDLGDLPVDKYGAPAEALRKRKYDVALTALAALEESDEDDVDVQALELGIEALKNGR